MSSILSLSDSAGSTDEIGSTELVDRVGLGDVEEWELHLAAVHLDHGHLIFESD
jgi:hypothetical protein